MRPPNKEGVEACGRQTRKVWRDAAAKQGRGCGITCSLVIRSVMRNFCRKRCMETSTSAAWTELWYGLVP